MNPKMLSTTEDNAGAQDLPLVSIVMFIRNRVQTTRRAIESVLDQDYPRIQLVVQDGASTDGTLEILRSYGDRIDLVSVPDAGERDGFWRALRRCQGEVIGTCLSDEQLMPGAIRRGVNELLAAPEAGAVTGDAYFSEYSGHVFTTWTGQDFDFLAYLIGDYCPHYSSTFFRRSALETVGMFDSPWREGRREPVEFEIWCRLGTQHFVKYVPHTFYKFGYDPGQLSHNVSRIIDELGLREMVVDAYLFGKDSFFGENRELRTFILRRQHEIIINHLNCNNDPEGALLVEERLYKVLGLGVPERIRALLAAVRRDDIPAWRRRLTGIAARLARLLAEEAKSGNSGIWRLLNHARRAKIQDWAMILHYHLKGLPFEQMRSNPTGIAPLPAIVPGLKSRLYEYAARRYRDRGLVGQALLMYRKAEEVAQDPTVAAALCRTALASPDHNPAAIETLQRQWSNRYMAPDAQTIGEASSSRPRRAGPIRIGYHYALDADSARVAPFLSFLKHHDRRCVVAFGYGSGAAQSQLRDAFDVLRGDVADLDNGSFAKLVRDDEIDIFVELSGLVPGHRFAAIANRCAPVQVSYIGHPATIGVANLDYVIGDEIIFPPGSEAYYTEAICRIAAPHVAIETSVALTSAPPCLAAGHVTFASAAAPDRLTRECLDLWARVLHRVPGARLRLHNAALVNRSNVEFFCRQFGGRGIDPARLSLTPREPSEAGLASTEFDIYLDTSPLCDDIGVAIALAQGAPAVSLQGPQAAAALGASLLTGAGLANLIAHDAEHFAALAADLAADSRRLAELRMRLPAMMRQSGLADPARAARHLEQAFATMVEWKWGATSLIATSASRS